MILIVGPTASGKTELALSLAREIAGEIVSADSRQIYREISAGTAKPVQKEIPYHLIDCASISERFDAGRYAQAARAVIADIERRGKIAIVAGGTGLYIRALTEGLCELPRRSDTLRRRLEEEAAKLGRARLHERLGRLDPQAAAKIPANNLQRLIRSLEVIELTGRPITTLWKEAKMEKLLAATAFRIDRPREELCRRIRSRAQIMWPAMLQEVRTLMDRFMGREPGFQSLGYPEAVACARGELSSDDGLERLIRNTNAYAKRQRTWFRHQIQATAVTGAKTQDMLRQILSSIRHHASITA